MNKSILIGSSIVLLIVGWAVVAKIQQDNKRNQELSDEIVRLHEHIAQLQGHIKSQQTRPVANQRRSHYHQPTILWGEDDFDPFAQMDSLRRQMNALMRQTAGDATLGGSLSFDPQMDIQEHDDAYVITLDIPGMQKDNINVNVQNGSLIVSGQRDSVQEKKDDQQHFYRQERSFGKFMRVIPLPDDAKSDDIDAQYKEGVLTVKIGRNKAAQTSSPTSKIQVK